MVGLGAFGPNLTVPMARTSMLAVPMAKASTLSVPTSQESSISLHVPLTSRARRSSLGGPALRDSEGFMIEIQKAAEAGVADMDELLTIMQKTDRGGFRISYTNINKHVNLKSAKDLLQVADEDSAAGRLAVCVIENVSPNLIKALGAAWDLEPEFFASHASNPPQNELWDHPGEWKIPTASDKEDSPNFECLNGIYEFDDMNLDVELMRRSSNNYCNRHIFKDGHWPVNVTTKITYMRVSSSLYLFLVDPPIRYEHALQGEAPPRTLPSIRFPYAQNRGGVLLPSPWMGKRFVPITALERVFRHAWQLEVLYQAPDLFPNVPFLYLMSFSLWYSKLHRLDREIKSLSFNEIRRPHLGTTDTLHDLREELSTLQTAVSNNQYFASAGVTKFYQHLWTDSPYLNMLMPLDGHIAISKNAAQLHHFLLETFQLLMTTIQVRDSQWGIRQTHENLKQTRQSVILTRLAAFYLPWTLASGIYGMNLKQLNGSGLPIWTFVITGWVLVFGTVLAFSMQSAPEQPESLWGYFRWTWWRGWFDARDKDYDFANDMNQMPTYY